MTILTVYLTFVEDCRWCAPKRYANYIGMEAWRVHDYDADEVTKADSYMGESRHLSCHHLCLFM